jgi:transposase, IS30 family
MTLWEEGYSISSIASRIERNKSVIARLFKRYPPPFSPELVASLESWRRSVARRSYTRIKPWWALEWFILKYFHKYWSPEQIAGRWREETGEKLSHETLYDFVYKYFKEDPKTLKRYMRRKGKKYQSKQRYQKYQLMDRRMIDDRPKEIEERKDIGHWEGDTIISSRSSKKALLTNVERKTGYLLVWLIQDKTSNTVYEKTHALFEHIPEIQKKSITYDNGREFALHRRIEWKTHMIVYFAHPYHSWERGTNENTNGLLRQFFPKKMSFSAITDKQLNQAQKLINSRPRKRLNYRTPEEVFLGKTVAFTVGM